MQTQELPIKPKMDVTLKSDTEMLGEVVVTGMQKMDKRLFTGAATKLSGDDVKLDGIAEVSRALEGRAAGVSVQNVSGTFGTAPKIRVRGATSIYGSSKPLWVVDGVIMEDVTEVDADALSSGDAETLISSAITGQGNGVWYHNNAGFNYLLNPFGYSAARVFTLTCDDLANPTYITLTEDANPANSITLFKAQILYPFNN